MIPVPATNPFSLQWLEQYELSWIIFDDHGNMIVVWESARPEHPVVHTLTAEKDQISSICALNQLWIRYAPNLPENITSHTIFPWLRKVNFKHSHPCIEHWRWRCPKNKLFHRFVFNRYFQVKRQILIVTLQLCRYLLKVDHSLLLLFISRKKG